MTVSFKIDFYRYRILYINLTVTTNQKSTRDIQNIKRKETKQNTKENQQTTREKIKKRRKEQRRMVLIKWEEKNRKKNNIL